MSAAKKKLNTDQVASELSESAFFQPQQSTSPQVDKTTSPQVDKPTKPLVEKYTTHLYPETIKAIRIYAAQHEMKDYEVAQLAFNLLLQESDAPPLSIEKKTQPRVEVETQQPVPEDLISLQEFADLHAINRNEAARLCGQGAITAIRQGAGRHTVISLAAKGRRDFWVQFHETQGFRACDDCPHT